MDKNIPIFLSTKSEFAYVIRMDIYHNDIAVSGVSDPSKRIWYEYFYWK